MENKKRDNQTLEKLLKLIKYNNDIKALKELLSEDLNEDEAKELNAKIEDLEAKIKELIKEQKK